MQNPLLIGGDYNMDTLDRFILVIYREQNLSSLLTLKNISVEGKTLKPHQKTLKLHQKIETNFQLDNPIFQQKIRNIYLKLYPNNYNPDEVDEMISWLEDKLCKQNVKNGRKNSIYLLETIVKEILYYKNKQIMVDFDSILEWNGFINKIDYNILYTYFLAYNNIDSHDQGSLIIHDNTRLKMILAQGMSDNHMHLKGSGYNADMNWYYFYSSWQFYNWSISEYMPKYSVFQTADKALAFEKLRLIRLYFVQLITFGKDTIRCKHFENIKGNKEDKFCFFDEDIEAILFAKEDFPSLLLQLKPKVEYWFNQMEVEEGQRAYDAQRYLIYERVLLKDMFTLLLKNKLSPLQIYLLNCYILGLSQFKFLFYQDNVGMGFEKFKSNENCKEYFLPANCNYGIYCTVFDKYYNENTVTQIEFRVAPKPPQDMIEMIKELDKANKEIFKKYKNRRKNSINYGIIIHYIKDKEEFNATDGLSRKESFLSNLAEKSKWLSTFLSLGYESKDTSLFLNCNNIYGLSYYKRKIIGIDAANSEFNCRPELFGCVFRKHRDELSDCNKLGFTYHVGEDFNTLANGLRAIDEVIEFLQLKRGDRLGHANALGTDSKKYLETKRGKIVSSIEEYLDDIVWMFQLIASSDSVDSAILEFLQSEFEYYKHYYLSFYKKDISIYEYLHAYKLRGDDPYLYENFSRQTILESQYNSICLNYTNQLNAKMDKHKECFLDPVARQVYYLYHFSKNLKEAGKNTIVFNIGDLYMQAVCLSQKILRNKIYKKELSIETNPSSNRKITHIQKYIDLPLFSFMSNDKGDETLLASINTDDSSIFQSDLQTEYAYVAAAQLKEGIPVEQVYDNVEKLRKASFYTSFIYDCNTRKG